MINNFESIAANAGTRMHDNGARRMQAYQLHLVQGKTFKTFQLNALLSCTTFNFALGQNETDKEH